MAQFLRKKFWRNNDTVPSQQCEGVRNAHVRAYRLFAVYRVLHVHHAPPRTVCSWKSETTACARDAVCWNMGAWIDWPPSRRRHIQMQIMKAIVTFDVSMRLAELWRAMSIWIINFAIPRAICVCHNSTFSIQYMWWYAKWNITTGIKSLYRICFIYAEINNTISCLSTIVCSTKYPHGFVWYMWYNYLSFGAV